MKATTIGIALGALGLLTFAALSPTASAQVTAKSGAHLMRVDWKKGQTYKFNVSVAMTPPANSAPKGQPAPKPVVRNSPISLKVLDVAKGVATVEVTSSLSAGQSATPSKSTVKMDNRGKVVGQDTSLSLLIGLPANPIKVGGKWTDTFSARNQMGAPMQVKATYTLKAIKGGVAEISASNTGSGGGMTTTGSGTYSIDLKDGMLRSALVRQTVTITMGQGQGGTPQKITVPTTVTLTRV
jgi:hypothetical protein